MISLTIKKGYNLNLAGSPLKKIIELKPPDYVAFTPCRIPFIKPKLLVKKGDSVRVGDPLIFDKRNPEIKYLSPGSGIVKDIKLGPRRVIEEIIISLDKKEKYVGFKQFSKKEIDKIDRSHLINALISGGLFQLFKQFPYGDTPDATHVPPKIYVHLDNSDPFHPSHGVYLDKKYTLFQYGMGVIKKLSESVICYGKIQKEQGEPGEFTGFLTHLIKGDYPSDNPFVVLYHTKQSIIENNSWYISGQDLLLVAELLKTGSYPTERLFCVSGDYPENRCYVKSRLGAPVSHLIKKISKPGKYKFISGGIFKGKKIEYDSYMGMFETSLYLLDKGDKKELFGFLRPGYNKPGNSRTFLSVFNKGPFKINSNQHGELRACINCSFCADVCPVDILPQFAMKSIHCKEIEEAVSHGILDCAECGLCSYVCPSKIEVTDIIKQAKRDYYREIN